MLDGISKMTSLDLATVDAIAVAAGMGSFYGTAHRIGFTAKGLDLPLISRLSRCRPWMHWHSICTMPGAHLSDDGRRRQQVYNAVYRFENHRLTAVTSQRAIAAHDLMQELNGTVRLRSRVIFQETALRFLLIL